MVRRRRKRGRYPSQIRYDKKHPTISIRVDQKIYDAFKKLLKAEKKTGKEFLIDCIEKRHNRYNERFHEGLDKGLERIPSFRCTRCGDVERITSINPYQRLVHEAAERRGWICRACATEVGR